MHRLHAVVSVFLLVFAASFSSAQTGTSTIRGTITDPTGRVVPGATVTLRNVSTNAVRSTTTTDAGTYVFDFIEPATYSVVVEVSGFKRKEVANLAALIGKPTQADVVLEVGAANEVVEVQANAQQALINTQDATLGNVIDAQQITQLPLEARAVVDLLSLQPGATREGYITGARADQSNVTLDGVDINNAATGNIDIPRSTNTLQIGGLVNDRGDITNGPVLRMSAESTEEFRVTTANGNANQGRSSGAQINIVTKSGTNSWHGAASDFYRTRGFEANDWFNNHANPIVPRPPLQRNTFEGAIGGPMMKNKAFFFYDYSGRRDSNSTSEARTVPLANMGAGVMNYQYCADAACSTIQQASLDSTQLAQVYPGPGINPAAISTFAAVAAKYPANDLTQGDQVNTGGYRFNAPTPVRLNSNTVRLDFNATSNQTLFLRFQGQADHQTQPQWLPGSPSPVVWEHSWGLAVGHTWTISNNWVNNFRYGLTREALTSAGDSSTNDVEFRFVFQPTGELHTLEAVVPVHNFTDDVSWIRGKHTIQFGGNLRLVSNLRTDYVNAFDFAEENPDYYQGGGQPLVTAFQNYLSANNLPGGIGAQSLLNTTEVLEGAAAFIGRLTQYNADFTFAKNGSLLPSGSPADRDFATQSYDEYVQDTWKIRPNLTLTAGLRYSLERPVYEAHGFETQPTPPLGQYLADRQKAGLEGQNYFAPITIGQSGPANGGKPLYNWTKDNFQPRIALAWSPDNGKTSLRGGFSVTSDYFGEALALDFDTNNTLGYEQQFQTHANTFGIVAGGSHPLAPLFTGFGQDVRSLVPVAGGTIPSSLVLPSTPPSFDGINNFAEGIQQSLQSDLHSPREYVWNFTLERELGKGGLLTASYVGRAGRSLLLRHDIAQFTDWRDPKTGIDWYTAGTALEKLRQKGVDISQVPALLPAKINQYFNDIFPAGQLASFLNNYEGLPCDPSQTQGGFDCNWTNAQAFQGYQSPNVGLFLGNDYTDVQAEMDLAFAAGGMPTRFMQPQYGALSAWASTGNSNYNAFTLSYRQRLGGLTMDFNYTWSHSLDDASGLQTESGFGNQQTNGAFVLNAFEQGQNYANSDFDIRHNINMDAIWSLPFGRGHMLLGNAGKAAEAVLGGWELSGIFRFNTGLPTGVSPADQEQWATNWEVQSDVTPVNPIQTCPNKPADAAPKLFGSCNVNQIYQNFRSAYPGEIGPRNYLRYPGYVDVDLGLAKAWKMPYNESHQLQFRWDVFNVTNTQKLYGIADFSVALDPGLNQLNAPPDWSNFTETQGNPRVMQLGVRYSF